MATITDEMIAKRFKDDGWLTFDDIRYSHLDSEETKKMRTAVAACRDYVEMIKGDSKPSMMIIASSVDGDRDRTGYGCGKTTLANIVYRACSTIQSVAYPEDYVIENPEFWIQPIGRLYTSKAIMSLFDGDSEESQYNVMQIKGMLIIDDLGREGSLKWEKRDPESQLEEKQNRYYTIINRCYEKKIPVVITSNLTSREMASFLGGASWSRLLQMVPEKYRINMTGIRDMRPILSGEQWF